MIGGGRDDGLRENIGGGGEVVLFTQNRKKVFNTTKSKYTNGHQFKGRVIRIVGIETFHAAQSIVDILGRPIWWCEAGHGVIVIEL